MKVFIQLVANILRNQGYPNNQFRRQICLNALTWYGEKDANIFQRFGNKQYLKGGLECTCVFIPLGRLGLGTLDLPRKHE